jgi:alpha-tubulin suppressor-like RCC1 family protein
VKKIALASEFGCALLEDKKVKCWGTGRIANDGTPVTNAKPTAVNGVEDVDELVASGAIACARSSKGQVTCWGATEKAIGTPPKGESFKQITAGFTHACALSKTGAVTCWGPGDWGGSGAFAKPAISGGATELVSGDRHACVILATKDKSVMCWGMNDAGQLGMKSDTEPHKKPVAVKGLTGAVRLAAGEASTCALLSDGTVRCWGSNGEGELGLGTRSPDERPAKVSALGSNVDQICLASAHGCALTKQSKLLCWGANAFGQLGDGTKDRRPTPTPVAW